MATTSTVTGCVDRRPAPGGSRIRKLILDKVRLLGPTEHQEIFQMLQTHGIAHSSNSNGVFINLSTVPDDVLATVKAFVDYCADNKKTLDEYEKRLQECKITHKFDQITSSDRDRTGRDVSDPGMDATADKDAFGTVNVSGQVDVDRARHDTIPRAFPTSTPLSEGVITSPVPSMHDSGLETPLEGGCVPLLGTGSAVIAGLLGTVPGIQVHATPTASSVNALNNGRFQAAKKRFSRRKIIDRRHVAPVGESPAATSALPRGNVADRGDSGVLVPEEYTFPVSIPIIHGSGSQTPMNC